MKNIRLIFFLILSQLFILIPLTLSKELNFETEIADYELYDIEFQLVDNFNQEWKIVGYQINVSKDHSIIYDWDGTIKLQFKNGLMDIKIDVFGFEYCFNGTSVSGIRYLDVNDNLISMILNFDTPKKGLFLDILVRNSIITIDLAFGAGDSQMIFKSIINSGFKSLNPNIKIDYLNYKVSREFIIDDTNFDLLYKEMIDKTKNDVFIWNRNEAEKETKNIIGESTILSGSSTYYGIAHEKAIYSGVDLPNNLPDDYWEPETSIDIGIYRPDPSESTIKSDLQYYNIDSWRGTTLLFNRKILAYTIYAHGPPSTSKATWWEMENYFFWQTWITPTEIENLWYADGEWEIEESYPSDMLIYACVCYGYSYPATGIPYMAKAFVDNGANAFMGSTVTIPVSHNDDFTDDFWIELCQNDGNIEDATEDYVDAYNTYFNPDWSYGTEIKIYGSTSATICGTY